MHKTGQAKDNKEHLSRVQEFMRSHFNVDEITHQWAGQNYKSADFLPYIGPKNNGSKQYFATGYSTDGLIYGTLAAMILSDQIMGTENPFSGLYRSKIGRASCRERGWMSEGEYRENARGTERKR